MARKASCKNVNEPIKVIRGWLTKLDAYGNAIAESVYIELTLQKGGQLPSYLKTYFNEKKIMKNMNGEVVNVAVEPDEFFGKGLYYISAASIEGYYYCFETNEHIKKMKAANEDIYATPFACVG